MTDQDFMREAIQLAFKGMRQGAGGPFGAVVVRDGEIIGRGFNRVAADNDPTAHAEIVAIRDACARLADFQLTDCTIYASCEPCPMCLSAIYWARIRRVVFAASGEDAAAAGFDDAWILEELGKDWEMREVEGIQELREEGRRVLEAWQKNPERMEY